MAAVVLLISILQCANAYKFWIKTFSWYFWIRSHSNSVQYGAFCNTVYIPECLYLFVTHLAVFENSAIKFGKNETSKDK